MRDILGSSLKQLKRIRVRKKRMVALLLVLSLVVSINVFWVLRQPGLTLAGDATCGIQEHTHDESCITRVCICNLPEEAHKHSDECYWVKEVPEQETLQLICTKTEEPHNHKDSCYTVQITPAEEISNLVCQETDEAHDHTDSCYEIITADPVEEKILNCNLQFEPHEHTESCFDIEVIPASTESILTCELSETAHVHEDACYVMEGNCELQEHVHRIECYADETADVETLLDWQNMFADYPFTGNIRDDLVGIAKTQVGYAESEWNFQIGDDGVRRGYTRYGDWYGTPYRDWSAAFVSFCLSYAGADPEKLPGNIGANAMAELWGKLGKYAPAGEYAPLSGDLVFFKNNTVGIVTEVQNATIYVIRGDIEGTVCSDTVPLGDESITGWGITEGTVAKAEPVEPEVPAEPEEIEESTAGSANSGWNRELTAELLDISNGPAFYIFAGNTIQKTLKFSLRNTRNTVIDLKDYLYNDEQYPNKGQITFTLLDKDDNELPKDTNNNYIVQAGTEYKLSLIIYSKPGFLPGKYQYQIPNGLMVNGGEGTFKIDGIEVGTWKVTDSGMIEIDFNTEINDYSEITVSATVGIQFSVTNDPLDFDGNIFVTVTPPPEQNDPTKVIKSGKQGDEAATDGKTDPSKIYWTVEIDGHSDSQIPGSIVTDNLIYGQWSKIHKFTESDMENGLSIGASVNGQWHSWNVSATDERLIWTETGWSYKMPTTVTCNHCGELTLGNDGWIYYINYTSTPDRSNTAGTYGYENIVYADGKEGYSWVGFSHGEALSELYKTGTFHTDAAGGSFKWEVTAVIPGKQTDGEADMWFIRDDLFLFGSDGIRIGHVTNDANKATVTATVNGTLVQVPYIGEATENDRFAWSLGWAAIENGIEYSRNIKIMSLCTCTEETCPWWDEVYNRCNSVDWELDKQPLDHCQCWNVEDITTFTLTYETTDLSLIEEHGGVGKYLRNRAELGYYPQGDDKNPVYPNSAEDDVIIPGLFKKELSRPYENSVAHYTITVNEAKLSLTNGAPLHIRDEMTETLAYISGSLVITAVDANGTRSTLRQDVDYTVTYDGTGDQKDANGKPVHVLQLEILHPQPVMYILDYDTTLIIPPGTTQAIKYTNSANITLWGQTIGDESVEKTHTDINIAAKSFNVRISKTCAQFGDPLKGAKFGLFNAHDGQITTGLTDDNGQLIFKTDVVNGVILSEHELYYIKELQAPPGYQLDDTKHWFCFCNNNTEVCQDCVAIMVDQTAVRIPYGQMGPLNITNEIMNYDLPATGGPGIYPLILVSVVFVITPLVYGSIQRRKRERRGVG